MKKLDIGVRCANCDEPGVTFSCARCLKARYCGVACQRAHWANSHKLLCFTSAESSVKAQPAAAAVRNACTICQEELLDKDVSILPCGHFMFHVACVYRLTDAKCPVCRAEFERARDIMELMTSETHAQMRVADQTGAPFIEYRDALFSAHSQGSYRASHFLINLFERTNPALALDISQVVMERNPSSTAIRVLLKCCLVLDELDMFNKYLGLYLSSFDDPVRAFNTLKEKFLRYKSRARQVYLSDLYTVHFVLLHVNNSYKYTVPVSFGYLKMLETIALARSLLGRELMELGPAEEAKQVFGEALLFYNKLLKHFPRGCFLMQSAVSGETISYTSIQEEYIKMSVCVKEFTAADALAKHLLDRCPRNEVALWYRIHRMFDIPFVM